MWEYFLVFYYYNSLVLYNATSMHIFKILLVYLNHLYYSFFFLLLMWYLKFLNFSLINCIFILFFYKIYYLDFQNYILLKNVFNLQLNYHFAFELLIGLVSIHPPLFYLGIFCWIRIFIMFVNNHFIYKCNLKINMIILINALFFGGIWGWLNFSWGYIWVYDYIEYFLLWLILTNTIWMHTKIYKQYLYTNMFVLGLFTLFYFSLRYSVIPSRHSFFFKIKGIFYKIIIYIFLYLNFLNLFLLKFFLVFFFKYKLWSWIFLYLSFIYIYNFIWKSFYLFINWNLILHLSFFFLWIIFFCKMTNYFFFLNFNVCVNYVLYNYWLTTTFITPKILFQQHLNLLIKIKIFKNNIFFIINYIFLQYFIKLWTIVQVSLDFSLFFLIFLILILIYIYK